MIGEWIDIIFILHLGGKFHCATVLTKGVTQLPFKLLFFLRLCTRAVLCTEYRIFNQGLYCCKWDNRIKVQLKEERDLFFYCQH